MNRPFFKISHRFSVSARKSGRVRLSLLCGAVLVLGAAGFQVARANNLTYVVTSTADFPDANPADGVCQTTSANGAVCTLRAAIQTTNAGSGGTIDFNIPGEGVQTIAPLSALPGITKPRTTINGYSQPGASANTLDVGNNAKILIELSGASAGQSTAGLTLAQRDDTAVPQPGDGTVVRGLAINLWSRGSGVSVRTNGNTVAGCFIGTDVTGTIARGNGVNGVSISLTGSNTGIFANFNTIGGAAPGDRNVISGNGTNTSNTGVIILNGGSDNTIQNNYIGLDATGTKALGNSGPGVRLDSLSEGDERNNLVVGNLISGNGGEGVALNGTKVTSNLVRANKIGTDVSGTQALGNGGAGVSIDRATGNTIGGTGAGEGNLLSGNIAGVAIRGDRNTVQGNLIGTTLSGAAALPNGIGVDIRFGDANLVGGGTAAARNVISGNGGGATFPDSGVGVSIINGNNNTVQLNLIGTNAAGTAALPNRNNGVAIRLNSNNNTLDNNNISGNGASGVSLEGTEFEAAGVKTSAGQKQAAATYPTGNTVANNSIGTNAANAAAIANGQHGVSVVSAAGNIFLNNRISGNTLDGIFVTGAGSSGNQFSSNFLGTNSGRTARLGNGGRGIALVNSGANSVGGANFGNTIAFNGGAGVVVQLLQNASFLKQIRGNSIFSNGGLGIDLEDDGVTPNDAPAALDDDIGANELQNFPVITSVTATTIAGTLQSKANTRYAVEVFENDAPDSSGFGEGQRFLFSIDNVTTNAQGFAEFDFDPNTRPGAGKWFSATATDPNGNTSEFSRALQLRAPRNRQVAILGTSNTSGNAVVFPDANDLPNPPQTLVTGLPTAAAPHGVSFFGQDSALIAEFDRARVQVVRVSTAQVLATIDTAASNYRGTGSIAVAPSLNAALAMGGTSTLYVIRGPFTATSAIEPIQLPGSIPIFQTQAIVFDRAGRAFVHHTTGISVLDAPYTSVAFTIPSNNSGGGAIAVSPDGSTLLTTNFGTNVGIYQAPFSATSTPVSRSIPGSDRLDGIVVTPDGTKALVVSSDSPKAAAISAPFSATSPVENIPLPSGIGSAGFEDIGISADSQIAIFTGNGGGSGSGLPAVFVRAPFGGASESFAVPIQSGTANVRRGSGAVRFQPAGLAPGLTISKSAPATVAAGQTLTYTLSFRNTGTLDAAGVVIRDPLPAGTSFVSATSGGALSGENIVFNVGALPAGGAARSVSFTARANVAVGATITNSNYTIEATNVTPVAGPPVTTRVVAAPVAQTLAISDARIAEGAAGAPSAVFTVTLSESQTSQRQSKATTGATVQFATADGTASQPSDYTRTTGTLTFAPGETTKTIAVPIANDAVNESEESFTVNLSQPVGATITDARGVGTVTDNDPLVRTLAIGDVRVTEGAASAVFAVTLTSTPSQVAQTTVVTVRFATANDTATQPSDYQSTSGTLTFRPGQTTRTITLPIVNDTVNEAEENFRVDLSQPVGATLSDAQATGTIADNDPQPTARIGDVRVQEGQAGTRNAVFAVNLSNASSAAQIIDFATANGTATAGSDYLASAGTLTIAPGRRSASISVVVNGDTLIEANETFFVNLTASNPQTRLKGARALIGDGQGIGTIQNDDLSSDLQITQTITPGPIPVGANATFTLQVRNNGPDASQNVVVDNTLPAGSSFVSASGAPFSQLEQVVRFTLGTLAVGATQTLVVTVRAPGTPGAFVNLAGVSGTGAAEINLANNSSSSSALAVAGPQNVTAQVQIGAGKPVRIGPYVPGLYRSGARFVQEITIRNLSPNAISGPVSLVLDGLPTNVELVNRGGVTTLELAGQRFIGVDIGADNVLSPGERSRVRLEFRLRGNNKPNFTPRVIAGPGTP